MHQEISCLLLYQQLDHFQTLGSYNIYKMIPIQFVGSIESELTLSLIYLSYLILQEHGESLFQKEEFKTSGKASLKLILKLGQQNKSVQQLQYIFEFTQNQILCGFLLLFFAYTIVDIVQYDTFMGSPADMMKSCKKSTHLSDNQMIIGGCLWLLIVLAQMTVLLTLIFVLIRAKGLKQKYKIIPELTIVAIIWSINNIIAFFLITLTSDIKIVIGSHQFNYGCMAIFFFSIIKPQQMMRSFMEPQPIQQLYNQFPQILRFWVPNFYFHKYLMKHAPNNAKYRPLLIEIIEYEHHYDELQQNGRDLLAKAYRIYDLYLNPEKEFYCDFSDYPDIKEDIQKKFEDINNHLDQSSSDKYSITSLQQIYAHTVILRHENGYKERLNFQQRIEGMMKKKYTEIMTYEY